MVSSTAEIAFGDGLKDTTTTTPDEVQHLVTRARIAQAVYEHFTQEQVDAIVRDFGKHVYDNAREVARMAFNETGLGVYEDKVLKALGKSRVIWNSLKGKKVAASSARKPTPTWCWSPNRWAWWAQSAR